ncbi:MAG TPA: hypothetical protein PJ988_22430, partial [Anaerolinea sp.]|nr:hypothetical protein [Anaerolinea sp.]
WGLRYYLVQPERRGWLRAGLAWIAAGLFQPLIVVVGWAVLGAHILGLLVWSRVSKPGGQAAWMDWLKRAGLVGVVSAPVVLYNFLSFQLDPFLSVWQKQNFLPSPPVTDYLLAYGVLLPFAVLGAAGLVRSINARLILPVAWVCAFPVLAYLPYNLQRRLPEGLWVALAILAVMGLDKIQGRRRGLAAAWLGTGFLPALLLMGVAFRSATILAPPSFQPAAEIQAFGYFTAQAIDRPAVAAALDTSTVLPAFAPVRVPIGHGPESLAGDRLRPEVESIYASETTDSRRQKILDELHIDYVFWGPSEKKLGGFNPGDASYLTRVYQSGGYETFQVEPGLGK